MSDRPAAPQKKKKGAFREYAEALITAVFVALLIRAFVIEAFKIPSGSMIPTLSVGDHIFVNKFAYGLRIPLTKTKPVKFGDVKRGDVVVFIYPVDEGKDFIKRVVGLAGDSVRIDGDEIWVNGEQVRRLPLEVTEYPDDKRRLIVRDGKLRTIPSSPGWRDFDYYEEEMGGREHVVQYEKNIDRPSYEVVVPPGHLFVIGDNRDNSADSREWGFVPEENVKGRAMFVWLSIDRDHGGIRWHEFGRWIE